MPAVPAITLEIKTQNQALQVFFSQSFFIAA
jgi:hypothetical protein